MTSIYKTEFKFTSGKKKYYNPNKSGRNVIQPYYIFFSVKKITAKHGENARYLKFGYLHNFVACAVALQRSLEGTLIPSRSIPQ